MVAAAAALNSAMALAAPAAPWVIGHRGLGQKHAPEPENSLQALEGAFHQGVSAVEFDVQLSADGQVVLAHDPRLERMTDGHGCVADHTLAELRQLHLKDGKEKIHPDLSVNTLEEALERIRPYDLPGRPFLADIHIKVYDGLRGDLSGLENGGCMRTDYARLTASVLSVVGGAGLLDRVVFTCLTIACWIRSNTGCRGSAWGC